MILVKFSSSPSDLHDCLHEMPWQLASYLYKNNQLHIHKLHISNVTTFCSTTPRLTFPRRLGFPGIIASIPVYYYTSDANKVLCYVQYDRVYLTCSQKQWITSIAYYLESDRKFKPQKTCNGTQKHSGPQKCKNWH